MSDTPTPPTVDRLAITAGALTAAAVGFAAGALMTHLATIERLLVAHHARNVARVEHRPPDHEET